jgi:hypothetical protein
MPKVVIDTSGVPDSGFTNYEGEVPPAGLYKIVWRRGKWGKSSGGKPMATLIFEINSDHELKKQYNGYTVWHNITHEESTKWRWKELFVALGTGPKSAIDVDDKGNITRIGSAKPGAEMKLKGKADMYDGKPKLAVDALAPLPGVTVPEDGDESFDEETSFEESAAMAGDFVNSESTIDGDEFAQGGSDEDPPF